MNVWVMNADGSGQVNLTPGPITTGQANDGVQPSWSPDGSKIAFNSAADVWVMNANGSGQTPLATSVQGEFRPDWSPDGSKIAYDREGQVWVMNADGSGQTQLTGDAVGEGGGEPSWSPDGSKIVFSSNGNGAPNGHDIFVMNADGTSITRVDTAVPASDNDPSWQPRDPRFLRTRFTRRTVSPLVRKACCSERTTLTTRHTGGR